MSRCSSSDEFRSNSDSFLGDLLSSPDSFFRELLSASDSSPDLDEGSNGGSGDDGRGNNRVQRKRTLIPQDIRFESDYELSHTEANTTLAGFFYNIFGKRVTLNQSESGVSQLAINDQIFVRAYKTPIKGIGQKIFSWVGYSVDTFSWVPRNEKFLRITLPPTSTDQDRWIEIHFGLESPHNVASIEAAIEDGLLMINLPN